MRAVTTITEIPGQQSIEPITPETLATYLNLEDWRSRQDSLTRMIRSSRARLELYLHRSVTTKTYRAVSILNGNTEIELRPSVRDILSVSKLLDDGTSEEVEYSLVTTDILVIHDHCEKVEVLFSAGYEPNTAEMEVIKETILMMCKEIYNGADPMTEDVKRMVAPLRRINL